MTTYESVFRVAKPIPGKCFIVGTTPFDSSPVANASASRPVVDALNENVRPSRYMNDAVEAGTSATGREVDVDAEPMQRRPVLAPCARATDARPIRPICGRRERRRRPGDPLDGAALLVDGDQERRLAAGRRGARSFAVSAISAAAS